MEKEGETPLTVVSVVFPPLLLTLGVHALEGYGSCLVCLCVCVCVCVCVSVCYRSSCFNVRFIPATKDTHGKVEFSFTHSILPGLPL